MPIHANVNFPDFISEFEKEFSGTQCNLKIKIATEALKISKTFKKKWGDRDKKWQEWLKNVGFSEEDWVVKNIDAQTIYDMKSKGSGDQRYAEAVYYGLHHHVEDRSFAHAVDELMFGGQFKKDGQHIFEEVDDQGPNEEDDWLGPDFVWALSELPNQPFDPLSASFILKPAQYVATTSGIATIPEIYVQTISEPESGYQVAFRRIEILAEAARDRCGSGFEQTVGEMDRENWSDVSHEKISRGYSEILRIQADTGHLEGNYVFKQNTAFAFLPKARSASFNAALLASADRENLVCPRTKDIADDQKREVVVRMILKDKLPREGKNGYYVLQESTYEARAVRRDEV